MDYIFFMYVFQYGGLTILFINVFFITLYYNKFPYFEKMKSNNLPWPWEQDMKKFKNDLFDILSTYAVNDFIIFPLIFNILFLFWDIRKGIDTLPTFTEYWV